MSAQAAIDAVGRIPARCDPIAERLAAETAAEGTDRGPGR